MINHDQTVIRYLVNNITSVFPAIVMFLMTYERSKAVSFTHGLQTIDNGLFIKNPLDFYNFSAYSNPLDELVWLSIGVMAIMCCLTVYITRLDFRIQSTIYIHKYFSSVAKFFYRNVGKNKELEGNTLSNSSWIVLNMLTLKRCSDSPNKTSARMSLIV